MKKLKAEYLEISETFFKLEKENKAIKDMILRNITNLFENGEKNYYKPVRVSNFLK